MLCIFLQYPDVNYALNGKKIMKFEVIRQIILRNKNSGYFKSNYDVNGKKYLLDEHKEELVYYDDIYRQLEWDIYPLI